MMARPGAGGGAGVLGLVILSSRLALADAVPVEVRVLSTPAPLPTTTVTVNATPEVAVDDRTVGAHPAAPAQGPATKGETFRDEINLFLRGLITSRPSVVEVADDLVSTVRVIPEEAGTTIAIFLRQPVTYTVTRPSAAGEIAIALKGRQPPPTTTATPGQRRPRPRFGGGTGTDQVAIDAAELTYDKEHNIVIARGDVTITRGVVVMRADEVRFDRTTSIVDATGHVVMTDPESTLEGDRARIDLNDESGWMERGGAEFVRSGYTLTFSRIEKKLGPQYHIEDGVFSTCRCGGLERPSWSVAGKTSDVKLNGIGVIRGATMRVKDVPVFWFPILTFPALTDRASGFLMPRFGYSARRGVAYEQPYYWNISKSQDATVALDVETKARIGLLGEYRYMLSREARGSFAGGFWNEAIRSPSADDLRSSTALPPENRWLVLGRATQPLTKDADLYLDAFAVSDTSLLKEIRNFSSTLDTTLRLQSARLTKTRLGTIQTWNGGLAQAEADYYQDLIDPTELAPQRAPFLQAEDAIPLLDNRLVGRLASQVTNYQRDQGFDGFRGDLSPELFLPFQLGRAVQGSVLSRLHGTMYGLGDNEQVAFVVSNVPRPAGVSAFHAVDPSLLPALDRTHVRGVAEVQGKLGTEVSRVFTFRHFGLEKLRHSIEPEFRYLYVPSVDNQVFDVNVCKVNDVVRPCREFSFPNRAARQAATVRTLFSRGYLFDELDAINRRNFFSFGFTTRLLGRPAIPSDTPPPPSADGTTTPPAVVPATPTRELLRLAVRNGVDPSREINTDSHLANLDLGLRFNPLDYLSLSYDTSVNLDGGIVDAQNATLAFYEPGYVQPLYNAFQQRSQVVLSYRFVEQNVNTRGNAEDRLFGANGTQNMIGTLYLRLGNYAGVAFGGWYDLNTTPQFNKQGLPIAPLGPHFALWDALFRVISPCNCWAAEFGVSDNFDTDERLFRFQITLLGLGSFGEGSRRNYLGATPMPSLGLQRPAALGSAGTGYF